MRKVIGLMLLIFAHSAVFAEPSDALVFSLTQSIVKVHVENQQGEHGIGSGVVIAQDMVATNCHVIANARGVVVSKRGENFPPVALKADWRHDLCILRFDGLPLQPIDLADDRELKYAESVFSISYAGNAMRPQTTYGNLQALYPLDGSVIIRSSAGFMMGASGGALLDDDGKLIGLTTFKSPGRNSYYYSLPVNWIKQLLTQPDTTFTTERELPFWSAPADKQPFFMQVVLPLQSEDWPALAKIASAWSAEESNNAEAWYYLGLAEYHLQRLSAAITHLQQATTLNKLHSAAYLQLGLIALEQGHTAEAQKISQILAQFDSETANDLNKALAPEKTATP